MEYNLDKRKLILSLKRVKTDCGFNIDQVYEIVYSNDPQTAPSRSSVARVFAEGSEAEASHFKFETTLKPIADALLDIDSNEEEDSSEELAKSLLKYKKDLLDENMRLKQEIRALRTKLEVLREGSNGDVNNVDMLRRLSNLEKIVYGDK